MDNLLSAAGLTPAICWQVVDCGLQTWDYSPEHRARTVREILVSFEVGRRSIEQRYALSFHASAKLHKHLRGWLARSLTPEERSGAFDFRQLLGRAAHLELITRTSGGFDYVTINAIAPAVAVTMSQRRGVCFMLDSFDPAAWDRIAPRLRDRIMRSPTYLAKFEHAAEFPADYIRPATMSELLNGDEIPW